MQYTLALTRHAAQSLQAHLLGDRSREQMAITLCGVNQMHQEVRLLVRDVVLLPADAFRHQSVARLELSPDVQAWIHQRAYRQGLVQVDWHSHPGRGAGLGFSPTDDEHEAAQCAYLAHRMAGVPYGSVVVNDDALDARLWIACRRQPAGKGSPKGPVTYRPTPYPLQALLVGDLARRIPLSAQRLDQAHDDPLSPVFDRQVRAFGADFQRRLGRLRVGLVGVGGLGSVVAENLSRLGVRDWVLVDMDSVDLTNLNRLVHATVADAQAGRPKVYVARSSIRQSNPKARVRALCTDVLGITAQRALKTCDLLVVATDNHSSRMVVNRLAVQYLIPLVHVGFHIGVGQDPDGRPPELVDISGEFAIPDLGRWCLHCAGIVDPQLVGWELAPAAQREIMRQRGYIVDTPAPAVHHLDTAVAAHAVAEVHNLVYPFKQLQRYLVYDALRGELMPLQVSPSDDCPVCSAERGVLGLGDLEPLPDYRRAARVVLPPVDVARRPALPAASPVAVSPATPGPEAEPHSAAAGDPDWP